jgi:UDP-glucose 4-epimerase
LRVLVTGGAGFIGSHLCDAFITTGNQVWTLDDLSHGRVARIPEGVPFHRESVLDAARLGSLITEIRPDLICHLAAQIDVRSSVAFPAVDAEINAVGTVNVLAAAQEAGARVIFASSGGAIYGSDAPIPTAEDIPPAPESPYGVAKCCAEQYVGLYNRLYGTEHSILRFANVYGPRQSPAGEAGVVSVFGTQASRGKPLTIYGDGKQTRDFVYVADCVAAVVAAADHERAGVWNVGTGVEVSVLELAALVDQAAGGASAIDYAPARPGELMRSVLSSERAALDLGWRPVTSLADGVRSVVNWLAAGAPDRAPA